MSKKATIIAVVNQKGGTGFPDGQFGQSLPG